MDLHVSIGIACDRSFCAGGCSWLLILDSTGASGLDSNGIHVERAGLERIGMVWKAKHFYHFFTEGLRRAIGLLM